MKKLNSAKTSSKFCSTGWLFWHCTWEQELFSFEIRYFLRGNKSGPGIPELFFPELFFPRYFSKLFCMWRYDFSFVTSFLLNDDVITTMITRVFLCGFNFSSYLVFFNSVFFRAFNFSRYSINFDTYFFRAFMFSSYFDNKFLFLCFWKAKSSRDGLDL